MQATEEEHARRLYAKPLHAVDVGQALRLAGRRLGRADELRVAPAHGEGQRHGRRVALLLRFPLEVLYDGCALMPYGNIIAGSRATFILAKRAS